ncbi:MAG TPA: lysophospholipase [Spirochaetota bacterium]|nr:lysophospholipase [Spirochaetota bacterium]
MKSYNHETGSFTGKGGIEIFFQKWVAEKAKAVVILVHGLGEHSGRYENLLKGFADKKISVFAIDHRGHGKSDGKKGHIDSFMDYVYDLKLFLEFIKEENKGLPVILYGHSMGGVIAAKYAMTYPDDLSMLVLSSAGFAPAFKVPAWKTGVASFFSSRISSLTFPNGLSTADLSHDADNVAAYENDPLVHNKVTARWVVEYIRAGQECLNNAAGIKKPLLVFHGKEDHIADYKASELFYNNASSSVKKLFIFDKLYHETINETLPEREKVINDVTGWIVRNIDSAAPAVKKAAAKPAVKKPAVKKAPVKKPAVKKPAVKKAPVKKAAVKKPAAKKAPVKKAAAKKPAVKKAPVKKAAVKKPAVKKAPVKKAVKKK